MARKILMTIAAMFVVSIVAFAAKPKFEFIFQKANFAGS